MERTGDLAFWRSQVTYWASIMAQWEKERHWQLDAARRELAIAKHRVALLEASA